MLRNKSTISLRITGWDTPKTLCLFVTLYSVMMHGLPPLVYHLKWVVSGSHEARMDSERADGIDLRVSVHHSSNPS
jgi:hypothetical protein